MITYDIILFLIFLILLSYTLIIYIRNRQSIKLKSNNMQAFSDQFFSNNQVSIIIPARNEESTIRTAILTLSKIIYPNFNIIIVNDNSTDNTKAIAMECSKFFQNDIFHVIDAPEIPKVNGIFQWMGKQHACWQGANSIYAKKSKYFLFLDSDVQVSPNVLKSIVTIFINEKVDLLSINLRISPNSLFSKMIAAPLLLLETLSIFNPKYTKKTNSNEIGVAYGGCIFISKDSYFDSGAHSHKNVKSKILDDIALATLYRSKGYFTTIKQNKDIHHINMYPSARSLYDGLDKHVKGQMQIPKLSLSLTLYPIIFLLSSIIFPFSLIYYFFVQKDVLLIIIGILVYIYAVFINMLTVYDHNAKIYYSFFFFTFFIVMFFGLTIRSIPIYMGRKAVNWRGRLYHI